MGLKEYRKLYMAELDAYVQKQMEQKEHVTRQEQDADNKEQCEQRDEENTEDNSDVALPSERFCSGLSVEAQLAELHCYEEKLVDVICGLDPQAVHFLTRARRNSQQPIRRHQPHCQFLKHRVSEHVTAAVLLVDDVIRTVAASEEGTDAFIDRFNEWNHDWQMDFGIV